MSVLRGFEGRATCCFFQSNAGVKRFEKLCLAGFLLNFCQCPVRDEFPRLSPVAKNFSFRQLAQLLLPDKDED
jgi:hypothetical protein